MWRRGWDSNPRSRKGSRALQARAFGQTMQPLRAYYASDYTTCGVVDKNIRIREIVSI